MILSFVVKIPYSGLHLKYDTPLTVPFSLPNVKYSENNDTYATSYLCLLLVHKQMLIYYP